MSDKEPPKNPWDDEQDKNEKNTHKPQRPSSSEHNNIVDDMLDQLQDKLNQFMKGEGGRRQSSKKSGRGSHNSGGGNNFFMKKGAPRVSIILIMVLALLGLWLSSGFFRVLEGEAAVLMRFGKMIDIFGPGLRYHWPAPIEKVMIRKVAAVNRIDGGMSLAARHASSESTSESEQALTLTADENMVIIGYSVQWRIKNLSEYLFVARDPEGLIIVAAESAIREVVGQTSSRMALTEGRGSISDRAHALLQSILDSYRLGIEISSFQLQRVEAPPQVVESFNDVQASLVDADRLKNEAEAYQNQIVPVARGQAEQIVQDAVAYTKKHVAEAEGEAMSFNNVYQAYLNNRDVTMTRYHMDTMTKVLKNSATIILDPKVGNMVPYLPVHEFQKRGTSFKQDYTMTQSSSQPDILTQGGQS